MGLSSFHVQSSACKLFSGPVANVAQKHLFPAQTLVHLIYHVIAQH